MGKGRGGWVQKLFLGGQSDPVLVVAYSMDIPRHPRHMSVSIVYCSGGLLST